MKLPSSNVARALALALTAGFLTAVPLAALAQTYGPPPAWAVPYYDASRHILSGIITYSAPYRLVLQVGPNGRTVPVDLKHGTTIVPVGTNLTAGMHVAVRGYWSNGTFIANHVRLRPH